MASEGDTRKEDVVEIELPAPAGWTKKLFLTKCLIGNTNLDSKASMAADWIIPKRGSTPHRSDVVFISPMGEEIKTKKQLEQYLKSHPGEPAASEFSWATVDTPRRSARLSEKSKAVEAPATESPAKKQKRSSGTKREAQEKSNADAGNEVTAEEEDDIIDKTKESINVPTIDTNDLTEGEAASGEALPEKPEVENAEKKDSTEPPKETNTDNANSDVKESNNATTNLAAADTKVEESNKVTEQEVVAAGIEIVDPKENSAATDAKIEEHDKAPEVLAGTKNVEQKETTPEVPSAQDDESKDAIHTEEGAPIETITPPESNAAASEQDISKDKQSAENAKDKDPALQEQPTTGS